MTVYLVTRHAGAKQWAALQGLVCDVCVPHLDPVLVKAGDVVMGTLPINLAAIVCEQGGRYLHLSLELPLAARGKELSPQDLERYGAKLEEFVVGRG
ncbi:MAG: CRISPR-associated protein Csx16 [Moraxellaceae bacterium]|nr:CRISPR-associated protein Csx16 [Pseudomonadales bacterium]MCP5175188.1 CRISPR-associated protein Csx16 [Moraxellaceae bacterium]